MHVQTQLKFHEIIATTPFISSALLYLNFTARLNMPGAQIASYQTQVFQLRSIAPCHIQDFWDLRA